MYRLKILDKIKDFVSEQEAIDFVNRAHPNITYELFEIVLTWKEKRQARYIELGCTETNYIMAMIQKECDNDNTLLDEYKANRQQVKLEIPKV